MPRNITLPLAKTEGAIGNHNSETLTTLGTQETERTMIDFTLDREKKTTIQMIMQVIRKRKQSLLNY